MVVVGSVVVAVIKRTLRLQVVVPWSRRRGPKPVSRMGPVRERRGRAMLNLWLDRVLEVLASVSSPMRTRNGLGEAGS